MTHPFPLALTVRTALPVLAFLAAACGEGEDAITAQGAPPPQGLAVLNSDYKSTAVSMVDPVTGVLVRDACITSGSRVPQLSTALSGDVTLPSQPQPGNELLLVDRTYGTLTWVAPATCTVLRQLNVGAKLNPHDVVAVSANKAYVTRYSSDPTNPLEGGDVAVIDPAGARIVKTIDMKPHVTPGERPILPNPDRMAVLGDRLYVTLNNLTADFMGGTTGRVVVVDTTTDAVIETIDLAPFKNCGPISRPGDANALVVTCTGLFSDMAAQSAGAGAAWIDLATTPPTVKKVAGTTFGRAVSETIALSPTRAFAITIGAGIGQPADQLWSFSFDETAPQKIWDGSASFTLGGLALDATGKKLFVADAADAAPKLHLFDIGDTAITPRSSITTTATGLPPRQIAWY